MLQLACNTAGPHCRPLYQGIYVLLAALGAKAVYILAKYISRMSMLRGASFRIKDTMSGYRSEDPRSRCREFKDLRFGIGFQA